MKLRMISRGIVVALVVMVGVVILIHNRQAESHPTARLTGTDLGAMVAPGFQLSDQNGKRVSLGDLRGHPTVLAFLYTHCPDECPLTAEKLHTAAGMLGSQASEVRWVAISVDPVGDTPQTATAFVHTHRLDGELRYLLGSREQLAPIWDAYHIGVDDEANGEVTHAGALYLLDGQGRERVFLGADFDPKVLAADLRALLGGA
ncbi:MAG TPA: SCO family protein [Ktedonobacterales bacterium]